MYGCSPGQDHSPHTYDTFMGAPPGQDHSPHTYDTCMGAPLDKTIVLIHMIHVWVLPWTRPYT